MCLFVEVEREVTEDDADVVAVGVFDFLESRTDSRAVWSLEVGELDNRHRRRRRPLCGIVLGENDVDPWRLEGDADGVLQNFLSEQALKHEIIVVGGTIPLLSRPGKSEHDVDRIIEDERVRASSLVFDAAGKQIARYDKMHLFDVVVNDKQAKYSESLSYEAGSEIVNVDTAIGNLGITVCYDMRFPELYRDLFKRGAELVTVPAAFTKVTGAAHWESLLRARAIENQCYIIAAAQGGRHSESRETWGHSMIIDPWGTVLAELGEGEGIAVATVDLEQLRDVRMRMPIAEHIKLP